MTQAEEKISSQEKCLEESISARESLRVESKELRGWCATLESVIEDLLSQLVRVRIKSQVDSLLREEELQATELRETPPESDLLAAS